MTVHENKDGSSTRVDTTLGLVRRVMPRHENAHIYTGALLVLQLACALGFSKQIRDYVRKLGAPDAAVACCAVDDGTDTQKILVIGTNGKIHTETLGEGTTDEN